MITKKQIDRIIRFPIKFDEESFNFTDKAEKTGDNVASKIVLELSGHGWIQYLKTVDPEEFSLALGKMIENDLNMAYSARSYFKVHNETLCKQTAVLSGPSTKNEHYRAIVEMGHAAVPLIMEIFNDFLNGEKDLMFTHNHFSILSEIFPGANAVKDEHRGLIINMMKDWIVWWEYHFKLPFGIECNYSLNMHKDNERK